MFEKIVKNLPYNPSMLETLSFYSKRVKQENSLRRLGLLFVALAMFIQMFAVMAPPEKSLAYSNDYIINGLKTRDDILRAWDGKTSDKNVAAIYGKFGITREDIANLPYKPNQVMNSCTNDYWTIGRTSLSAVSKSGKIKQQYKNSEVPVNYGSGTVYLRQLKAWDIVRQCNTYNAFEGWKNGKQFWILVDCGNFTQVGQPNLKKPGVELRKTIDGGPRTLKPGEQFSFRFEYRNNIEDSQPAENVMLEDEFDLKNFDIVNYNLPNHKGQNISKFLHGDRKSYLSLPLGSVSYTTNFQLAAVITVKLKANLTNGTKVCNGAKLAPSNAKTAWSGGEKLCITVNQPEKPKKKEPSPKPCEFDSSIPQSDSRCHQASLVCTVTNSAVNRTTKEHTIRTVVNSTNEYLTRVLSYEYDFGDGSDVLVNRSSNYADTAKHTYADGTYTATVVVNYKVNKGSAERDESSVCEASVDSKPDEPLSQSKTAVNLTQDLSEEDSLTTKAKAGDVIEYSLVTHNSYGYARANVTTSDYIGDLLDYADLDRAFLEQQGGTFNEETRTLSWKAETVPANSSLVKKFRVKVKDPVPSTNQPSVLTTSYDCQISNRFGNQMDIPIDCPLPKSAEYITKRLPNTGPGTSLLIGFCATSIIAYFFARSHLLTKELDILRTDFAQSGGV